MSQPSMFISSHCRYCLYSSSVFVRMRCRPSSHHSASSSAQQSHGASRISVLYSLRLRSLSCFSRKQMLMCCLKARTSNDRGCGLYGSTCKGVVLQLWRTLTGNQTACDSEAKCFRLLLQGVISGIRSSFFPLPSVTITPVKEPYVPLPQPAQSQLRREIGASFGAVQLIICPGWRRAVLLSICNMCHSACSTCLKLSKPTNTCFPSFRSKFPNWIAFKANMYTHTSVCFYLPYPLSTTDPLSAALLASCCEAALKQRPTCFCLLLNCCMIVARVEVLRLPRQPVKWNRPPYCKSQHTSSNGDNDTRHYPFSSTPAFATTGDMLLPFTSQIPR